MKLPLSILIEQERKRREAAREEGARVYIEAPLPPTPERKRPEMGESSGDPVVTDMHNSEEESDRGVTVFSIFGD